MVAAGVDRSNRSFASKANPRRHIVDLARTILDHRLALLSESNARRPAGRLFPTDSSSTES